MNRKIQLLKSISRMEMSKEDAQLLLDAINQKQIDEEFLLLVCSHKLHNLLYKHIMSLRKLFEIKKSVAFILSERFIFTQQRAAEHFDLVKKIVPLLKQANINCLFLKGTSIANDLYGSDNFIYRSFNDIDILISKEHTARLNEILEFVGFIQGFVNDEYQLVEANRKQKLYWSLNTHQEHKYLQPSPFSAFSPWLYNCIDVNTTIFQGGKENDPLSTIELLRHARANHSINAIEFNSLDYAYELIQLCIHLYKDTFVYEIKKRQHEAYSLIKFCDIREFILKYKTRINWEEFLQITNSNGLSDHIYVILLLIANFYGDLEIDDIIGEVAPKSNSFEIPDWENVLLK